MKILIVLASIFAASQALDKAFIDEFVSKVRKFGEVCIAETNAAKEDMEGLFNHKLPSTHEGKCLLFCLHKKFNVQNDDGSLNKDGAMSALEPLKAQDADIYDKIVKVFETCSSTPVDSDPCIYASNLAECAVKEGKALGLDEVLVME